jgi:hypothetical protein
MLNRRNFLAPLAVDGGLAVFALQAIRCQNYLSHAEALEAGGLSE